MKRNNKKGFTITELVIVIAVIAILAAVLIPTFSNVISNAKQSAALQTCSNAMKDYSAIAAQEGKSVGTGMMFVNDGFVFVYINGSLHYVGELASLDKIDKDGEYSAAKTPVISGLTDGTTYTTCNIKVNGNVAVTVKTTGTESGNTYVLAANEDHKVENLYFYHTTINNVEWWGYFTLEGTDANYQTQGANYSRVFGAATQTNEAVPAVSVEIPA
ncbi:MAG: type II secretion system protein [Candidatus Fimimonas sp.]